MNQIYCHFDINMFPLGSPDFRNNEILAKIVEDKIDLCQGPLVGSQFFLATAHFFNVYAELKKRLHKDMNVLNFQFTY